MKVWVHERPSLSRSSW